MKVLILSCNTGGGHNACAQALREQLLKMGHSCEVTDALGYVSERVSRFVSNWHVRFYRHFPKLYGKGYRYAEEHPSTLNEDSAAVKLLEKGSARMRADIASGGYGAVICTHLFPALMLSFIQHIEPLDIKTCFLATDYTASPSCNMVSLDFCVIPDAVLEDEFLRAGIRKETIVPCGIPVRQKIEAQGDKRRAKRTFGVDPSHRHIVVMSGSMGAGPIRELVTILARHLPVNCELTVVCSSNKKLRRRLRMLFGHRKNVHVLGFEKNVSALLDSADVFLTKPGGISTTEAAVKGVPMVLLDAVAGCETHNRDFFVSHGGAVSEERTRALAKAAVALVQDEARCEKMRQALLSLGYAGAAERICNLVCEE